MADPDPVRFEISSRRHLARAMRIVATGIEQGAVPVSERGWGLVQQLFDEVLGPPPPPPPPPAQ